MSFSCARCGESLEEGARDCPLCGAKLGKRVGKSKRKPAKRRRPPKAASVRRKFSQHEEASKPTPQVPQAARVDTDEPQTHGCASGLRTAVVFVFQMLLGLVVLVLLAQLHDYGKKARRRGWRPVERVERPKIPPRPRTKRTLPRRRALDERSRANQ